MPSAKSKVEKFDEIVDVVPVVDDCVEDVVMVGAALSSVVPVSVDPVVSVPLDKIVAAPAATTHNKDNPAPIMEPVSLIFILATPAY